MLVIKKIVGPKEAKDGRKYKTVYFQPEPEVKNGRKVISNEPLRARNVWDLAPDGESRGDELFYDAEEGAVVPGEIKTIPVEDYFIPSENGRDEYNGQRGSWVNQYTTPVFEHENPYRVTRNQDHNPINPETGEILDNRGEPIKGQDIASSNNGEKMEVAEEGKDEDQPF